MQLRRLGSTGFVIPPLVFGGNVFCWTINEKESFTILDALYDNCLVAIDTPDVYSSLAAGNRGGESETIIGNWLTKHSIARDKLIIFTKVGADLGSPGKRGLSARWIINAVEDSFQRLQTDYIDLYFSHWPDINTPYEETLNASDKRLTTGKIRAIGASKLDAGQLKTALDVANIQNLPRYQVLQPEYNIYDRAAFDDKLKKLCIKENIGVVTYYSLASGFLTGKYRRQRDLNNSLRKSDINKYLNQRGERILKALQVVSDAHQATLAEVALAWLMAFNGITAPIASATTVAQVESFVKAINLTLTKAQFEYIDYESKLN
ncbi:aldo/keto reductase [Arsenophonus endosymbiont of Aphis craccivora]|uniref:aldo/keto reductase n=1 Tax=Arsenophonus endosymbiont of Aphis craccivora TaxID=1231049 RepID=UPI0015DC4ADC|nr:aldo/keto reductase [Arsenophonus endosymbiont of Aphis craccivora]QLK88352.1 aldo/keto reductase [Arsenophonus endosymbiont of Aphis craccivora]